MARKPNTRIVLNRAKLEHLNLAIADGMGELARTIVEVAEPPDAEPFGVGLVTAGDWGVWVNGRKVAGGAQKPRSAQVRPGIVALAGFGFPGRFQEVGTAHHAAQPFLSPAVDQVLPHSEQIMAPVVKSRIGTRPD